MNSQHRHALRIKTTRPQPPTPIHHKTHSSSRQTNTLHISASPREGRRIIRRGAPRAAIGPIVSRAISEARVARPARVARASQCTARLGRDRPSRPGPYHARPVPPRDLARGTFHFRTGYSFSFCIFSAALVLAGGERVNWYFRGFVGLDFCFADTCCRDRDLFGSYFIV